ncbi:MAG: MFS transporter [Chloroflexi bacterium]|nr:MFS transporter [Chloroflexota bacterium]
MNRSKIARYAMFGMLYFAQGAILSYFTALNSLYLLSFNISMSQIGLMGTIAMIPFVIKIFLGMLSDKVNFFRLGFRRPYIVIGLLVQSLCLFIVPFINPAAHFGLFALTAFILMTGMALYDTCTDGLALDTTPKEEEGAIQGFMVGGRALGVVIISSIIGIVAERSSWSTAFNALAVLTLLPLPLVLMAKETERPAERQFEWKAFSAFTRPSIITLALLGALYSLITNAANQIVNPFLQAEFNISLSSAGFFTTIWGVGVILGSLTGGRLIDRIGQRRAVHWAIGISIVSIALLALIINPIMAWPLVAAFGLAFGYYETVYFAISMNKSDPRIAASMFSILMAIANIGTGIGLALSGSLVDALNYRWTFFIIAGLNLLALPLLGVIFKPAEDRAASESPSPAHTAE